MWMEDLFAARNEKCKCCNIFEDVKTAPNVIYDIIQKVELHNMQLIQKTLNWQTRIKFSNYMQSIIRHYN